MIAKLDASWLADHALPDPTKSNDKNDRGRVLVVGGSRSVPDGIRLTGEAVLRAGAGKLRLATVSEVAIGLGVLLPEAAMTALPATADGEIAAEAAASLREKAQTCDALVLGPAMSGGEETKRLVAGVFSEPDELPTILLDAGALTSARDLAPLIAKCRGRVIFTPHHGEMASLVGVSIEDVARDAASFAQRTAERFGAVVLLKGTESYLAEPGGTLLHFAGGPIGLGTGGSGDVLAGIIGGLAAREAPPIAAAAWGCWLHARAGEVLAARSGRLGYLARELLPLIPGLMDEPLT